MMHNDTEDKLVDDICQAAEWVHQQFERIKLPFASDKAILLASRQRVGKRIRDRLGIKAGRLLRQGRSLGLDLTLQKIKARRVQGERLKDFAKRVKRPEAIRRKRWPARRIFRGSILPAVLYGIDLVDMSDKHIRMISRAALRFQCADIKGANTDLIWTILEKKG